MDLERIAHLLWDVDRAAVDPWRHRQFIVERVLRYGDRDSLAWLLENFSRSDIADAVRRSRRLDRRTANYWVLRLKLDRGEVACLNLPWPPECFY